MVDISQSDLSKDITVKVRVMTSQDLNGKANMNTMTLKVNILDKLSKIAEVVEKLEGAGGALASNGVNYEVPEDVTF